MSVNSDRCGLTMMKKNSEALNFAVEYWINSRGQGRNRTGDTRLFRPLLYRLSYLSFTMSNKFTK